MSDLNLKLCNTIIFATALFFLQADGRLGFCAKDENIKKFPRQSHVSPSWNCAMNQADMQDDKYPGKKKITPETIRLTINEYYIPEFSELLNKGVDYLEWLNQLDDPYLNRYKVDVKIDPDDERLKVFWKRKF